MPYAFIPADAPRIVVDVLHLLHHIWSDPLSTRDEADVVKVLTDRLPRRDEPDLSTPEGRRRLTQAVWPATDVRAGAPLRASPAVAMSVRLALALETTGQVAGT